ncbi:DUF4199 domain-containing protein [Flavobacterium aurantiibacter]|uniref:DUF4199 domain-containing protein n=1 Tax=Flavobacterium aurantiibacter TaxID=2023067 RepID=A0A256A679_9FLAO|nr:DUF4199 domain-containing protein [Flavobacterium aurantiibacter]OYQ48634.1 hypothetical protein CHX27_02100 [Flavobacterium aurantiibacter]
MKNFQIEYKWALILTVLGIVWIALERAVGLHDQHIDQHPIYTNIVVLPSVLVYYLALREKKSSFFKNQMDWKQGFLSGSVMAIFAALMSIPAVFFSLKVVSPDFFANQIKYQIEVHGRTLETASSYFNMNTYLITSAIGSISFGIVVSAIVAYFLKSKTQKG